MGTLIDLTAYRAARQATPTPPTRQSTEQADRQAARQRHPSAYGHAPTDPDQADPRASA